MRWHTPLTSLHLTSLPAPCPTLAAPQGAASAPEARHLVLREQLFTLTPGDAGPGVVRLPSNGTSVASVSVRPETPGSLDVASCGTSRRWTGSGAAARTRSPTAA